MVDAGTELVEAVDGLSAAQVDRLREEYGVYAVSTGRICVAALNTRNLDTVANAIAKVLT